MIKKNLITGIVFLMTGLLCAAPAIAEATSASDDKNVKRLVVYVNKPKERIAPEIYGHFSEHLGRCIYEGFWVGEDSSIPNVRGIRTDVVEARRKSRCRYCDGPAAALLMNITGRKGLGRGINAAK